MSEGAWVKVPWKQAYEYVGMFAMRGQGMVRDSRVGEVEADYDAATKTLTVIASDSSHGMWRFTLNEVSFLHTYGDAEMNLDDALGIIKWGTWEIHDKQKNMWGLGRPVHSEGTGTFKERQAKAVKALKADSGGELHASRSNLMGHQSTVVKFDSSTLEVKDMNAAKGACKVCGGTSFHLEALASIPVRLVEDDTFKVNVENTKDVLDKVTFGNTFSHTLCDTCGTRTDIAFGFMDKFMIGGKNLAVQGNTVTLREALED